MHLPWRGVCCPERARFGRHGRPNEGDSLVNTAVRGSTRVWRSVPLAKEAGVEASHLRGIIE